MAAALFTGAGVALVTLFDDDGRLLVEETVEHAVDLVERGIAAVVVSGTTGGAWALDVREPPAAGASSCAWPPWRPLTGAPRSSSAPGTSTTRARRGSSGPRAMPAPRPCSR